MSFLILFSIIALGLYAIMMFLGSLAEAIRVSRDKNQTGAQKFWAWILGPVALGLLIVGCLLC